MLTEDISIVETLLLAKDVQRRILVSCGLKTFLLLKYHNCNRRAKENILVLLTEYDSVTEVSLLQQPCKGEYLEMNHNIPQSDAKESNLKKKKRTQNVNMYLHPVMLLL